jgi:prevent-host-death family protein
MGKMVGAAEFKANCLRIMREVERTGEAITVTQRGRPMVEIKPAGSQMKQKLFFGCMKGTVTMSDDDPSKPAYDGPWNAELDSDEEDAGTGTG